MILILPGAWHGPEHFAPLIANLASHGVKALCPKLPTTHWESLGLPIPSSWEPDVKLIRDIVEKVLSDSPDTDVALLCHSYSGMPGSIAIEGLDKASRIRAGFKNGISVLLAISSVLVPAGVTSFEWAGEGRATNLPYHTTQAARWMVSQCIL
jgi:hypothetical protein